MTEANDNPNKFNDLRHRAEQAARSSVESPLPTADPEKTAQLIYELKVHQIELEMQNEELRQAQTALQESQSKYFELYDLAPVGYLTLNNNELIVEANLNAAIMLRMTKSSLINRPLSQFIHSSDQDEYYRHFRQFLKDKRTREQFCEVRLKANDDESIWVRLQTSVHHEKDKDALQLHIILSNITERCQAEAALRENQQRLSWVMEATGEGLWDWDITNKRVTHNAMWFKLLGLTINQEHAPAFYTTLIHEDDRDRVMQKLNKTLHGKGRYRSEHRLRRTDGSYIWVLEHGIIVDRDKEGKALRMVGSFTDISERKKMERLQRQHQNHYESLLKLEVSNQTIAAIAHELNQPLSAAASFADASRRLLQKAEPDLEKAKYAINEGSQQIQRAGQVVHELFNFLRSGEVITVPAKLNHMVRRVINMLKEDGHLGNFKTILKLAENLPKVNVNVLQFEKVLVNLIRNSIEAMQEADIQQGAIAITVCTTDSGSCAQITISDNGPGLAAEAVKRVFEPFYSTKPGGLGMGLAISRALIEVQGGQLWCQPEQCPGASFHITLPFAAEEPA